MINGNHEILKPNCRFGVVDPASTLTLVANRCSLIDVSERERTLGPPEHEDTLSGLTNLASVLRAQGKLQEARELHGRALRGREGTLGPEHVSTLESINLALVLKA